MLLARLLPLWGWLQRNPLLCLCAGLALWGAYERHQHTHWRDYAKRLESASAAASAAQKALRAAETKAYQEKAAHADTEYRAALADARSATADYVRRNRVRPEGGSCAPVSLGQADHAAAPQAMPSPAVVVDESDVQRAAEWQAFGVACHDWALSISGDN